MYGNAISEKYLVDVEKSLIQIAEIFFAKLDLFPFIAHPYPCNVINGAHLLYKNIHRRLVSPPCPPPRKHKCLMCVRDCHYHQHEKKRGEKFVDKLRESLMEATPCNEYKNEHTEIPPLFKEIKMFRYEFV